MSKQQLALLFLFIAFFTSQAAAHAVYVSLCDIQADSIEGYYRVSVVYFTDDLQLALHQRGEAKDSLAVENPALLRLGADYAQKHLQLVINGKPVRLDYLPESSRATAARVFLNFRFQSDEVIRQVKADNKALFEVYEEQQNMVRVTVDEQRKSLLLSAGMPQGTIIFFED